MNRKTGIFAATLLFFLIGASILYTKHLPQTVSGEKNIAITVFHGDGSEKTFAWQTNAAYLAEALLENEIADGETGSFGLYITTVDGETADAGNQEWWCITKGGETVTCGAENLPIADGDRFELTLMEGF